MIPGETILGLDFGNHLWVVLTPANSVGDIVIVNLTTHGRGLCGPACTTIAVGEHAFVTRESCVYYRGIMFNPVAPLLQAREQGFLRQHDRVSAGLNRYRSAYRFFQYLVEAGEITTSPMARMKPPSV